jgi:hypothetical protein
MQGLLCRGSHACISSALHPAERCCRSGLPPEMYSGGERPTRLGAGWDSRAGFRRGPGLAARTAACGVSRACASVAFVQARHEPLCGLLRGSSSDINFWCTAATLCRTETTSHGAEELLVKGTWGSPAFHGAGAIIQPTHLT